MPDPASESRCGQPSRAFRGVVNLHHRQMQRLAVQAAAQHQGVSAPTPSWVGNVVDHPVVGGGGGGQHRHVGAQFGDQRADTAVIRTEIVAPVRDAVRLVDHDQAGVGRQRGQHLVAEVGVVEPFRADQQHVEVAGGDALVDLVPFGDVARVDRRGTHAGPLGGRDLVAHQRQQRRHDDRRPATGSRAAAWRR